MDPEIPSSTLRRQGKLGDSVVLIFGLVRCSLRELPENHAAEFAVAVARTWLAGRQLLRQMLRSLPYQRANQDLDRSSETNVAHDNYGYPR